MDFWEKCERRYNRCFNAEENYFEGEFPPPSLPERGVLFNQCGNCLNRLLTAPLLLISALDISKL